MAYPLGNSTIKPFSTTLEERRAKLAAHILRSSDNDPMRQVTYKPGSADAIEIGKRRVGRPRQHWTFHSNQLIHNILHWLSCLRLPKWKYPCSSTPAPNLKHCRVTRPGAQAPFLLCCGCQQWMHGEGKLTSSKAPFFQVVVKKSMYVQSLQKHMEFPPLVCRLSTSYI